MAHRNDPLWRGIARHGSGWRATASGGRGQAPRRQHFPHETDPRVMQAWRADAAAEMRVKRKERPIYGTFAADAARYLQSISALPTHQTRRMDIQRWVEIFGRRRRDTITKTDIRYWRDRWAVEPRKLHPPPELPDIKKRYGRDPLGDQPYAASTINHWLRALSNLWTELDGRRAYNPVREVPEVVEPDALPRAIPTEIIEQILDTLPDRGRYEKGKSVAGPSLVKRRLTVMAYTGLTPAQLGRLTRADIDFTGGAMLVRRRKKGKGVKARRLPLLPAAVDAFRALDAVDGWGPFSASSARKSFLCACRAVTKETGVKLSHLRPNDLRHSFGTTAYRATRSLEAVRQLLMHAHLRTTERYTLAATDEVLATHLARAASHKVDPGGK